MVIIISVFHSKAHNALPLCFNPTPGSNIHYHDGIPIYEILLLSFAVWRSLFIAYWKRINKMKGAGINVDKIHIHKHIHTAIQTSNKTTMCIKEINRNAGNVKWMGSLFRSIYALWIEWNRACKYITDLLNVLIFGKTLPSGKSRGCLPVTWCMGKHRLTVDELVYSLQNPLPRMELSIPRWCIANSMHFNTLLLHDYKYTNKLLLICWTLRNYIDWIK